MKRRNLILALGALLALPLLARAEDAQPKADAASLAARREAGRQRHEQRIAADRQAYLNSPEHAALVAKKEQRDREHAERAAKKLRKGKGGQND